MRQAQCSGDWLISSVKITFDAINYSRVFFGPVDSGCGDHIVITKLEDVGDLLDCVELTRLFSVVVDSHCVKDELDDRFELKSQDIKRLLDQLQEGQGARRDDFPETVWSPVGSSCIDSRGAVLAVNWRMLSSDGRLLAICRIDWSSEIELVF